MIRVWINEESRMVAIQPFEDQARWWMFRAMNGSFVYANAVRTEEPSAPNWHELYKKADKAMAELIVKTTVKLTREEVQDLYELLTYWYNNESTGKGWNKTAGTLLELFEAKM